jgi:hypothetical protein
MLVWSELGRLKARKGNDGKLLEDTLKRNADIPETDDQRARLLPVTRLKIRTASAITRSR